MDSGFDSIQSMAMNSRGSFGSARPACRDLSAVAIDGPRISRLALRSPDELACSRGQDRADLIQLDSRLDESPGLRIGRLSPLSPLIRAANSTILIVAQTL